MTVEDTRENSDSCICPTCPSYPGKGDPFLYCARGESPAGVNQISCVCPGCTVWADNALDDVYYCMTGRAE